MPKPLLAPRWYKTKPQVGLPTLSLKQVLVSFSVPPVIPSVKWRYCTYSAFLRVLLWSLNNWCTQVRTKTKSWHLIHISEGACCFVLMYHSYSSISWQTYLELKHTNYCKWVHYKIIINFMVFRYTRSEVEMASSKKVGTKEQHELISKAGWVSILSLLLCSCCDLKKAISPLCALLSSSIKIIYE